MRLFFAVGLPVDVREALAGVRIESADYRWAAVESLHVTLAFLGEQPADLLSRLGEIGHQAAGESVAGRLSLGDFGSFGPRRAPRVLWVGLIGDLDRLHALHGALITRLRAAGFPIETRPLAPHITLARRRSNASPADAPPSWPPAETPRAGPIPLATLTLFESRLSPRGATYLAAAEFPLGPAPRG